MAGAGVIILFVVFLVAWGLATGFFGIFVSHYWLVTLIDSCAGNDEVQYPRETITDWWWKPLFCVWILIFCATMSAILTAPLFLAGLEAYLIGLGLLLWFLYPLSALSALYTQNWFFLAHPVILWRMLRHFWALLYVYLSTLLAGALCAGLVAAMLQRSSPWYSFWWVLPASILIPAAILFYARTWGRFAWRALNFAPRRPKGPRTQAAGSASGDDPRNWDADEAPTLDVQEIDEAAEGVREGLPPGYPGAVQAGPPAKTGSAPDDDEWATEKAPYPITQEPGQSTFQETATGAAANKDAPTGTPTPAAEEEDEWATDKKPYDVIGEPVRPAGSAAKKTKPDQSSKSDADKPVLVAQYYAERAKKENAAKQKRQREADSDFMPPPSKKTPTFQTAFVHGVWRFMFFGETVHVWVNLAVLTFLELFFASMVVQFWPSLD
jgi:hypothetical protein